MMFLVRPVARLGSLSFVFLCASLLVAGCGEDDTATTSKKGSRADQLLGWMDAPSIPETLADNDPPLPAVEPVAGSEPELAQSEPETHATNEKGGLGAQAGKQGFEPGSFLGTVPGSQTRIKMVLTQGDGIEMHVNGRKMEMIQAPSGNIQISKVKWSIVGEHIQLTWPNLDRLFYLIESSTTFVGPVARLKAGGLREVTPASARVVFQRSGRDN